MTEIKSSETENTTEIESDDMSHDSLDDATENEIHELSSDMEVVGPGQMLSEARLQKGLSQKDIATRLNFHLSLVKNIENDVFDKKVPETYNRGYLRNFAKLVNISEEDVLASYDILGVAEKQGAEMQSFSQNTKKQAEHSRLMWVTYLMIVILIGSTVYWFFNENTSKQAKTSSAVVTSVNTSTEEPLKTLDKPSLSATHVSEINTEKPVNAAEKNTRIINSTHEQVSVDSAKTDSNVLDALVVKKHVASTSSNETLTDTEQELHELNTQATTAEQAFDADNQPKVVQFVFSGDCWVNIYDATGERVAYGVKQKGYIMNFKGFAPFKVTVARPEFVTITYQNESIDLSTFSAGNIAKFTLPLITN